METENFRQKSDLLAMYFTNFYNELVTIYTDATYKELTEEEKAQLSEQFKGYICATFKGLYGDDRLKALFETVSREIYQ